MGTSYEVYPHLYIRGHNGPLCRGPLRSATKRISFVKSGRWHHLFLFLEATSVLKYVFTAVTTIVNDNDKEARLANRVEKGKHLSGRRLDAIERTCKNEYIEIVKPCCYRFFMAVVKTGIGMQIVVAVGCI